MNFVKPAPLPALPSLDAERRALLRRLVGADTIARAEALVGTWIAEEKPAESLIALEETGLLEDLKHDWLAEPAIGLLEAVSRVASGMTDDRWAGGQIFKKAADLMDRAEPVAELMSFFDMFAPSIIHTLVRPACADGVALACLLVEWMTAEDDELSADRASVFESLAEGFVEHMMILHGLPYASQALPPPEEEPTGEREMELLVGVRMPEGPLRWTDVCAQLEAEGHDLCDLAARQLGYLGEYRPTDWISKRNYFDLALRTGRSAYPLLAHRACLLMGRLVDAAIAVDSKPAIDLFPALYDAESIWMIDAQLDYEGARERYLGGDQAAIVEAYGVLAEGTLRRYASLIIGFEHIVSGSKVQEPLLFPTIGDIETQLGTIKSRPLPSLILRFLERKLRNADAHANVVVGMQGELRVKTKDGSIEDLRANRVYGKTAGLRSILDGVDVAANIIWGRERDEIPVDWSNVPRPAMSEHLLGKVINEFAEQLTPGYVTDVRIREGVLTMTYHGEASYDQLLGLVNRLSRLLSPERPMVRIVNPSGEQLQEFHPLPSAPTP